MISVICLLSNFIIHTWNWFVWYYIHKLFGQSKLFISLYVGGCSSSCVTT